jgi:hypothetical protein
MAKYGTKAQEEVKKQMHKLKRGTGRPKSRKQAIAIGLSEARKKGGKAPPPPSSKNRRKK